MLSKRIVISIIVIGCLVQFITTNNDGTKRNRAQSDSQQGPHQSGKPVKPEGPSGSKPNLRKMEEEKKKQNLAAAAAAAKKAEDDKKKIPTETKPDNPVNSDEDEDPVKEKPVGHFRKMFSVFKRLNKFRKKICPFRFVGRLLKKNKMGSNKLKPTDDEESDP
ncbi:uncharacterized protein LOC111031522 [Myzus persicae]|uniref:uncharacterized protein LOC111031522 n=1 Tax=Myzus persicae TaxID=13164 RepID=UPI000B933579|nr:uncharacterized protein LOC111031522 [Myzus persicae]